MNERPETKPQAPMKELSGRVGKYEIRKLLGRGAMGMVYLARDTVLERDVALKVMAASIAEDPAYRARFEREAKAVAKMAHPNVVTVFDLGDHEGSPYIAMELLKGRDLQRALREGVSLSLEMKISIVLQILAGLAHAHQLGIVHRDIKPANIFLGEDGSVKIMDFGVARLTTAASTSTGSVFGTADYMSPEQVTGAHVDGRSDVFSAGCVLYEVLSGEKPFHAENLMGIFYKIIHEEADLFLVPTGPEYQPLLPILRKSMAKSLEERYATAYDFAVDLREYLRVHVSTAASQEVLVTLLEMKPPPVRFVPLDESLGPPPVAKPAPPAPSAREVGATSVPAPTARVGATVRAGPSPPPAVRARPSVPPPAPRPAPVRPPAPRVARPSPSRLPLALGVVVLLAVAGGGFLYWRASRTPPAAAVTTPSVPPSAGSGPPSPEAAPTTVASAPDPRVAAVAPPTAPPPPTVAPQPTFAEARGKGAGAARAAQSAFAKGDYAKAIAEAQAALRADPSNGEAQRIVESALAGQRAQERFRSAEAALGQSDLARAQAEAEAGRTLAPWDPRGPDLVSRIQQAQRRIEEQKKQQLAARLDDLLRRADAALAEQKYDVALGLYDEALKVDPQNQRATLGRTSSLGARAVARAAASGTPAGGRSFVAGQTSAQAFERTGGSLPAGFDSDPEVTVRRGTQAADLPGKIHFEVEPEAPRPGERYNVKIFLLNEGQAPIALRDMVLTTTINRRKSSGSVPSMAKEVAPQQKALLLSVPDLWKEGTTDWSMEVTVRTLRGETYRNQLTWR